MEGEGEGEGEREREREMLFANVSQRLDNEKRFKDTEFFLFQRNQKGKKIKVPRQTK